MATQSASESSSNRLLPIYLARATVRDSGSYEGADKSSSRFSRRGRGLPQMLPEQLDAAPPPIAAPPPAPTVMPIKIHLLLPAWALAEICLTCCRSMDAGRRPG